MYAASHKTKSEDRFATAERELLGSALLDETAAATVVSLMRAEMFSSPFRASVFSAVDSLLSSGERPNLVTVSGVVPGKSYELSELASVVSSSGNEEFLARIVQEGYFGRKANEVAYQLQAAIRSGDDVFEAIDEAQEKLSNVTITTRSESLLSDYIELALAETARWRRGERTTFVATGIYSLDRRIGGYPVGVLTTLASHTGGGKTAFLVSSTAAYARRRPFVKKLNPPVVFSAEMPALQLFFRFASNEGELGHANLMIGRGDDESFDKFDASVRKLEGLRVYVDDNPRPTLSRIRAIVRRVVLREGGVGPIFVDYDEKVHTEGQTEELRVAKIAEGLNQIAKDFSVPIVALSQYSRAASKPGRPDDSWLRYSGKKEAESGLILHWYWPHFWVRKGYKPAELDKYEDEESGLIIASKNRFGPTGDFNMIFNAAQSKFYDPAEPSAPEPELPF